MTTIRLNWTANGGTESNNQLVQRKNGVGAFATIATLGTAVETYDDTTASDNILYTYKIVNDCTGGDIDSDTIRISNMICPAQTITPTTTTVQVEFDALTDDITWGGVNALKLFDAGGNLVSEVDVTGQTAVDHTFTGLTPGSYYAGTILITDGLTTKVCTFNTFTTV